MDQYPSRDREESDDDALLEALENEDDSTFRAQRIEQLNAEFAAARNNAVQSSAASIATVVEDNLYPTLKTDSRLLNFTTQSHRCVIHFAHPDFARCNTMDEHIRALALQHHEVRFARVDVRDTPFVVEKLKVRVLPCVIGFRDGLAVERLVGFEGLGAGGRDGTDGFSTATLEKRLVWKEILTQTRLKNMSNSSDYSDEDSDDDTSGRQNGRRTIRSGNSRLRRLGDSEDDDDDDWD
ncbi:thioredoxin domain-containing protein [Aspergillus saccharolyticus JOP 1030-1]|uniref:Putative NTP binding protein n=1 Tax=Aspergillus saccharolyticus JOP 1030-1 TaxID=1450539 RepID=A0A318Z2R8_9EURO|nr:putative NTP binding protein [Aspergillus saccharolyticus JOP 1030-1]PYH40664.1 putative NTP binding protein [Aspergillus saccharolyticus JOP 1030-1]